MRMHAKMYMNILHQCDVCPRTFKDAGYLRQHRRGAHGRGWMALCGHVVDWPPKLHRHQRKCDTCKEIKAKKKGRPKFNYKKKLKGNKRKINTVLRNNLNQHSNK